MEDINLLSTLIIKPRHIMIIEGFTYYGAKQQLKSTLIAMGKKSNHAKCTIINYLNFYEFNESEKFEIFKKLKKFDSKK